MISPKFSLGYNFDYDNFIILLEKYKEHIESVYFPPPKKILGSGRIIDEPVNYKEEIAGLIKKCRELKIAPFMILNSTIVSPVKAEKAAEYVKELHKKNGLMNVTVTDPFLIMKIKKEIPGMFIEASTLCRIQKVQEAKYFKEIGVSRMTSDRETIRDLPALRKLSEIMPLRVLANEGCIKNCI
jgi:collagenase-like PrtC family protease